CRPAARAEPVIAWDERVASRPMRQESSGWGCEASAKLLLPRRSAGGPLRKIGGKGGWWAWVSFPGGAVENSANRGNRLVSGTYCVPKSCRSQPPPWVTDQRRKRPPLMSSSAPVIKFAASLARK